MKREARIVDLHGHNAALVEIDAVSQCLRCSRGEGCGAVMFDGARQGVQLLINTDNPSSTHDIGPLINGQRVLLEIDEHGSGWLLAVFGAYGLPLAGMLLSTLVSSTLIGDELYVLVSAGLGLCGGIFAWRLLAPSVLERAGRGLCLQSARIVGMSPSFPNPTKREP